MFSGLTKISFRSHSSDLEISTACGKGLLIPLHLKSLLHFRGNSHRVENKFRKKTLLVGLFYVNVEK
jgi:hypothetical protein